MMLNFGYSWLSFLVTLATSLAALPPGPSLPPYSPGRKGEPTASPAPVVPVPVALAAMPPILNVQLGDTAFLPCHVPQREEFGVSWVRRRDWHILAADSQVYSRDERVRIAPQPETESWTLFIKFIRKEDEGVYDCQVSTRKGVSTQSVDLRVTVPQAVLVGGDDVYVGASSPFSLTCVVTNSLQPPQYVLWWHDGKALTVGGGAGGTNSIGSPVPGSEGRSISFEPGPPSVSRLTVNSATAADSGRYSCSPASGNPAHTNVHVATGNEMAAIQAADASKASKLVTLWIPVLLTLFPLRAATWNRPASLILLAFVLIISSC